jgi:hypothetical protein
MNEMVKSYLAAAKIGQKMLDRYMPANLGFAAPTSFVPLPPPKPSVDVDRVLAAIANMMTGPESVRAIGVTGFDPLLLSPPSGATLQA